MKAIIFDIDNTLIELRKEYVDSMKELLIEMNYNFSEESRYNNPNPPKPELSNDFEFLPMKRSIVIKKEKENKEQYMDLLLEADPKKSNRKVFVRWRTICINI
ncbi:MAG: HAD family hydrolase [Clostridia bacterium]|nr:HAD family hydrolase [Clostridia bacterium]